MHGLHIGNKNYDEILILFPINIWGHVDIFDPLKTLISYLPKQQEAGF